MSSLRFVGWPRNLLLLFKFGEGMSNTEGTFLRDFLIFVQYPRRSSEDGIYTSIIGYFNLLIDT